MIPTHDFDQAKRKGIIVNHLAQLNAYDFTEVHRHAYFEFFFFKKGGGVHYIDFKEFPIRDNSVHIVAPGQVHQMERELDSEGYVILFEMEAIEPQLPIQSFLFQHICLDASELSPIYTFSLDNEQANNERIKRIFELAAKDDVLSRMKLQHEIQLFCLGCMEHMEQISVSAPSDYMQFRILLKDNYTSSKKVKEYAEKLNITERALNELVKRNTGKSASEIIYAQIIMEAKRLLRTGISVKETAYALNFEDPAHFSKFFKGQTGQAPSDFQNYT